SCLHSSTSAKCSTRSKRPRSPARRMRADILLVGFGNVGRRFARLLIERQDVLRRQHDLETRIVGISTGRHGAAFVPWGLDAGAMLQAYAAGRRLPNDTTESGGSAVELIARLGASDAPV